MAENNSKFVALTMNYWGRGATAADAERNMRKAGGSSNAKRHGVVIVELPDGAVDAYVDDFSHVRWDGTPGPSKIVKDTRKKGK